MGYEDFVWFILSEEDKTSETSLEYWYVASTVCLVSFRNRRCYRVSFMECYNGYLLGQSVTGLSALI